MEDFDNEVEDEFGVDYKELDGFSIRTQKIPSTFWGPYSQPALFKKGMYGKSGRLAKIGELIAKGFSVRKIREKTGASPNTISKMRKTLRLVSGLEAKCKCGLPAIHQGWCSHRVSQSSKRQLFLKNWATSKQAAHMRSFITPEKQKWISTKAAKARWSK